MVELLVVIAILAAVSIVAYNGIQLRTRDLQRRQDIASIYKALEMYYADKGEYPPSGGAGSPNTAWSNSQDASWDTLANHLKPYISTLPKDPINTTGAAGLNGGSNYNYSYLSIHASYCYGTNKVRQMFAIGYNSEGEEKQQLIGECGTPTLGPYPSTLRVVK